MITTRLFKFFFLLLILTTVFACSSADENVKIKTFGTFYPEKLKNHKPVFMPFILEIPGLQGKYEKGFLLAKKEYLKNWKLVYPHQSRSIIDTKKLNKDFKNAKNKNPISNPKPWVELGKKIGSRYIVVCKFAKPVHNKIKQKNRETVYVRDKNSNLEVPRSMNVYINVNMWYQKGKMYIIDVKLGKCVYFLSKETKSGFRRKSTTGYGPARISELIKNQSVESLPTHPNAIVLYFKNIFKDWKD